LGKLPQVKGAISPIDRKDNLLINAGMGAVGLRLPDKSLERNPSVLSRKELIEQQYNLLLETRLPNIMQLMNSEKTLGGGGYQEAKEEDTNIEQHPIIQKMFSNQDADIKNLNKNSAN
jgi:hypothetical protein